MEEDRSDVKIRGMPARCYLLMFFNACGFIIAIYFIVQAFKDPQEKELKELSGIINQWQKTFKTFNDSSVFLQTSNLVQVEMFQNFTENWKEEIKDFPKYTPLSFTSHQNISGPLKSFKTVQKNSEEFNVTLSISFSVHSNSSNNEFSLEIPIHIRKVYPANEKVCRNSGKGFWNRTLEKCFFHYDTLEVCLLLDSDLKLSKNYIQGCNSESYLTISPLHWQKPDPYTYVNSSIFIQLRSIEDPYVFACYNSLTELSSPSSTYKTIGLTFLAVSVVLAVFILIFWLLQRRNSRYLKMRRRDAV